MCFSFNVGPVHIVSLSTEYYFYLYYGITQPAEQYRWLEKDLMVGIHAVLSLLCLSVGNNMVGWRKTLWLVVVLYYL